MPQHTSPCMWTKAVSWLVGLLVILSALGGCAVEKAVSDANKANLAVAAQAKDIEYIRESIERIEAKLNAMN